MFLPELLCFFDPKKPLCFSVRKNNGPQIIHPPHLYTNTNPVIQTAAGNVGHQQPVQPPQNTQPFNPHHHATSPPQQQQHPIPYNAQSPPQQQQDTATYVNVVSPVRQPPPYQPAPTIPPLPQQRPTYPPPPHPGSAGHVPYSPAFQTHHHHQHHGVRPIGIANVMPRDTNQSNAFNSPQRQALIGLFLPYLLFDQ